MRLLVRLARVVVALLRRGRPKAPPPAASTRLSTPNPGRPPEEGSAGVLVRV
jgi:hypothetical protein